MKVIKWFLAILIVVGGIGAIASCAMNFDKTIIILKWSDGDSFSFRDKEGKNKEARLVNADTPEMHDQEKGFKETRETGRSIEFFYGSKGFYIMRELFKSENSFNVRSLGIDIYERELLVLNYENSTAGEILIKLGLARVAYWWMDNNYTNKEKYFSAMEFAIKERLGFWSFIMDGNFNSREIPVKAKKEFNFLIDNNSNTRLERMNRVFKKWKRDRKQYPTYFLNKYLL